MADFKLNYTGTQINTILANAQNVIGSDGIINVNGINCSNHINTNGAYGFQKAPASFSFDSSTTSRTLSVSITSHGRPIFIVCSGDLNPTAAGSSWVQMFLYRDSTQLCTQIAVSESNSQNIPFCCCYLDIVGSRTRTYKVTFQRGAGTFTLTENGAIQGPNFCVFEI